MKKLQLFACAMLAAGTMVTGASASTYTANFDSATLDPTLGFNNQSGFSESSGGGQLVISDDVNGGGSSNNTGGSVYTNFDVSGDYVAKVNVDFSGLPMASSSAYLDADFGANPTSSGYYSGLSAVNDGQLYVSGFYTIAGATVGNGFQSAPGFDLTYEVSRSGNTVTESVAQVGSSDFSVLNSYTDPKLATPSTFTLTSFYRGDEGARGTVIFSDFTITTPDAVSAAPEPSMWALMSAGVAMVGGMLRWSRKRAAASIA